MTVVEALIEFIIRKVAMVEDALMYRPAVVEVGARAVPANTLSKAPFWPGAPVPQAAAAPEIKPLVSTFKHWVEPVMVFRVKPPATVTAPLNLEVPRTAKVVLGTAVPMPTRFSLALTTNVVVSTTNPSESVEEAEPTAEKAPVTLNVLSIVDEARIYMPAVDEVGVKVAWPGKAMTKFCSVALPVWLARDR